MKAILINAVAGCLTLFISASVQGAYTYTTVNVPGASGIYVHGIDGGNIVGSYSDGSRYHGFLATSIVPVPAAAWMALPLLAVIGVVGKMRRIMRRFF